jgi:small subunit ribosomal protein S20
MPNIKSAIKRVGVNQKKNEENKTVKSKLLTFEKKFKAAISAKELDSAQTLLNEVFAILDSAAKENIIHKNSANSKKASLSKLLDNAKKTK